MPPSSDDLLISGSKAFPTLNVSVELLQDHRQGVATIKLTGPSDIWFGVGFAALTMQEEPYTIIVDGMSGTFQERRLAKWSAGEKLPLSLEEAAPPSYINGACQVELRRTISGTSQEHYTFSPSTLALNLIAAVGASENFGMHTAKAAGELILAPL